MTARPENLEVEQPGPTVRNRIGSRYNKLTVVEFAGYTAMPIKANPNRRIGIWRCKCDCGNDAYARSDALKTLKSCGCASHPTGEKSHKFRGYKGLYASYWKRLPFNAKTRNIKFDITMEQAWGVWEKQKGRCALTGEKMILSKGFTAGTASLDRIFSDDHYHVDNIQWVLAEVNRLKGNLNPDRFLALCLQVTKHARRKST